MSRDNVFLNADGLNVGFGTRDVALNAGQKIASSGVEEVLVFDLNDATLVDLTTLNVSSDAIVHGASIPAGSFLISARLVVQTVFTSAGSPTLDIGTYDAAGVAVDANGLFAATALTALDDVDDEVAGAGSQIGTVLLVETKLGCSRNVATYTAGAAQVVVRYQPAL